jgi:hypothetical protein
VVKIEFKELREDITAEDLAARKILAEKIYQELSSKTDSFSIESERVTTNTDNVIIGTSTNLSKMYINSTGS